MDNLGPANFGTEVVLFNLIKRQNCIAMVLWGAQTELVLYREVKCILCPLREISMQFFNNVIAKWFLPNFPKYNTIPTKYAIPM